MKRRPSNGSSNNAGRTGSLARSADRSTSIPKPSTRPCRSGAVRKSARRTSASSMGRSCSRVRWIISTGFYVLYLVATNLKSVSSMRLHRDLDITQKSAWHLAHRVRRALGNRTKNLFAGPVEVDETYVGGLRRNMPASKRKALTGRGPVGKVAVAGIRDRATNKVMARVVPDTTSETLGDFITGRVIPGTKIYTDDATAYTHLPNHASVKHSVAEYVRGPVHIQGIESFWATLKRAHKGTFHRLSAKHLHRYVDEFVSRHNMRDLDTLDQMALIAGKMENAQLRYKDLVASV